MWFFVFLLIIVLVAMATGVRIVEQNTVAVVEFLGRFNRIMRAGLNIKIPIVERVAQRITLRQQNFAIEGKYPSKDKVIVSITTNLIYTVDPSQDGIVKYAYTLQNRDQSIGAIIENSLRTYIAKETHEGILEKKEELALHIKADLEKQLNDWGILIIGYQITNVNFPLTITDAMSEVVASEQLRKAAANKGEAVKIQSIKESEAEKERKRLQGEGIALEREAIAKGLRQSVEIMQSVTQQSSSEIISMLTLTQYLDTLKTIGVSDNSKVIFVDTNIHKTTDLMQQLMSAAEAKEDKK